MLEPPIRQESITLENFDRLRDSLPVDIAFIKEVLESGGDVEAQIGKAAWRPRQYEPAVVVFFPAMRKGVVFTPGRDFPPVSMECDSLTHAVQLWNRGE